MESQLIIKSFAFLFVAVVASHAGASASLQSYWDSQFPNTPMPKAIKDSLSQSSEWAEEKGTSVSVGKGGVNVNAPAGKGKPGGTRVNVGHGGVSVGVAGKGGKTDGGTRVNVGHGGVSVGVGHGHSGKGKPHGHKPVSIHVGKGNPFDYNYAATADQLHDDRTVALFFKPTDIANGRTMTLHFMKTTNDAVFPDKTLEMSSKTLPGLLARLSIPAGSPEATEMEKTVKHCENYPVKGEEKLCATSLQSMVDFARSKLGKNIRPVSTITSTDESPRQKYKITRVEKLGDKAKAVVVCHKQNYPFAVFYCHKTQTTEAYEVSLVGSVGGDKVEAAAVCHKDTAAWNPKHLAFQVLKVKPGTVPVCHFLPQDHIVWVAN